MPVTQELINPSEQFISSGTMRKRLTPNLHKVALVMIVGPNESFELSRCLRSIKNVKFSQVIICTTSNDEEVRRVALGNSKNHTTQVVHFDWCDDFGKARNFARTHVSDDMDYFMWLDADDAVSSTSAEGLNDLFKHIIGDFEVVKIPYVVAADEYGKEIIIKERVFKNDAKYFWKGAIHEAIPIPTDVKVAAITGDIQVLHLPMKPCSAARNVRILEKEYRDNYTPRIAYHYGVDLIADGQVEKGIKILEDMIHEKEAHSDYMACACIRVARHYAFRIVDGIPYIRDESIGTAETYLKIGLSYSRYYAEIYVMTGDICDYYGRLDEAIHWYKMALKTETDKANHVQDTRFKDITPYEKICMIQYKLGEYEFSLFNNRKALEKAPNDSRLLDNRELILSVLTKDLNERRKKYGINT